MMPNEHRQQALVLWQELTRMLQQVVTGKPPATRAQKRKRPQQLSPVDQMLQSVNMPETIKVKLASNAWPIPQVERKADAQENKQDSVVSRESVANKDTQKSLVDREAAGNMKSPVSSDLPLSLRRTRRKSKPNQAVLDIIKKGRKTLSKAKEDSHQTDNKEEISKSSENPGKSNSDTDNSPLKQMKDNKRTEKSPQGVEQKSEDKQMEQTSTEESETDLPDDSKAQQQEALVEDDATQATEMEEDMPAAMVEQETNNAAQPVKESPDEDSEAEYNNAPEIFERERKKRSRRTAQTRERIPRERIPRERIPRALRSTCKQCGKVLANQSNLRGKGTAVSPRLKR